MSLAVYHPQSSEAQRELEMDPSLPKFNPNLPLFQVMIRLAHVIGLPVDAVKNIRNGFLSWYYQTLTLIGNRRLHNTPSGFGAYLPWAGTQRMVNRRRLISKYVSNDERVGWLKEVTDLGFITYDGPAGFRVQGQGTINVLPRYRSPF